MENVYFKEVVKVGVYYLLTIFVMQIASIVHMSNENYPISLQITFVLDIFL